MYVSRRLLLSFVCFTSLATFSLGSSEFKRAFQHKKADKAQPKQESSSTHNPIHDELQIHLKEPVFSQGIVKTTQGGVITAEGIRIQAQNIEYTNKIENGHRIVRIVAEDDLLIEFGDRAFVGKRLDYDFVTKTGTLLEGKTFVDIWFLGGDKIELREDGSYVLYNAFITTCESQENTWELKSENVSITKEHLLAAKNIKLNFFKIPVFWLPSFKSNLKLFSDPPIRYKIVWDKGLGPRATMRYRVFSWEDFNLYFRLDYRLKRGLGGALESEYYSPDERTTFVTRTYGAHDKVVSDERGPQRYRLQGLFSHESIDRKTHLHLTYDKLSDVKMVSDFRSSDFEIDTQKRTRLIINHQEDVAFGTMSVQPQINRFESINQELPHIAIGVKPFEIASTGILSENYVTAGFLDYVYAKELHNLFHNTHAIRLQTKNQIYRTFFAGPIHLTPNLGVIGLFYNNSPSHNSIGQGTLTYGANCSTELHKTFPSLTHTIEPYAEYLGLSQPIASLNEHYFFNINDGLFQINALKIGVRNFLFSSKHPSFTPTFSIDLYTYGFFFDDTFSKTFPKGYLSFYWSRPSFLLNQESCWNFQEQVLDFCNSSAAITVNEDLAFGIEMRHRSKYDWRKASHQSFILDMARSIQNLLESPLSDGRNTFLGKMQIRLSPKWTCHFESHTGWGRRQDPAYNAFKFDVTTLLSCNWNIKFSYTHTTNDDRFGMQIQLAKYNLQLSK